MKIKEMVLKIQFDLWIRKQIENSGQNVQSFIVKKMSSISLSKSLMNSTSPKLILGHPVSSIKQIW
jgi:hypothetical protein